MFAVGSAGYVFGAQLGNAIGNEIRRQEFLKRCMILHGWRQGSATKVTDVEAGRLSMGGPPSQGPVTTQIQRPPTVLIVGQ